MDNNYNIKSSTIEKGLEIAKDFVDKLITPAVEETGLLIKDQITMWRFKNQIKILNNAKSYCDKHNIEPKKISLKVLSPLLEYSSLEEENYMQDKWSILLSNLIDSEQNIENHVFPYILSQLSSDEFQPLEDVYEICISRRENLTKELLNFKETKIKRLDEYNLEIKRLNTLIEENKKSKIQGWNKELWDLEGQKRKLEIEIKNLDSEENKLLYSIKKHEEIPDGFLKNYEISNLTRLGLIKEIKEFYAESQVLEIPLDKDEYSYSSYTNVDLDIDMESFTEIILTELGELFFKACKEKK
ncbi:hypothetical protein HX088_01900 [Empedobacter sp. 225-1]|uniref:Abi-alpha family protein n=1 Tax=Empedobacter sp. 225-1 TaxID=2746725 RepID=UPI00257534A4|nr:hypothetical protein [Empedobacter sp. 225-1]MDM1522034.1 hypothetical protein [Empedobacter sp. 225-1]